MNYPRWITFKNDPTKIEEAKIRILEIDYKFELEDCLLNLFISYLNDEIEEQSDKSTDLNYLEINNCILKDFPLEEQCKFISRFVPNAYRYSCDTDHEIIRLVYLLWDNYMHVSYENRLKTYPHNEIYESLYSIKQELRSMKDMDYKKQMDLGEKYPNKSSYYNWHLLGFLPLLGDKGLPILRNIIKQRYSDAEDMLLFGIYHYNPKEFNGELKSILLHWYKHKNIDFSSATGMLFSLALIINKYNNAGIDLINDPILKQIFHGDKYAEYITELIRNTIFRAKHKIKSYLDSYTHNSIESNNGTWIGYEHIHINTYDAVKPILDEGEKLYRIEKVTGKDGVERTGFVYKKYRCELDRNIKP